MVGRAVRVCRPLSFFLWLLLVVAFRLHVMSFELLHICWAFVNFLSLIFLPSSVLTATPFFIWGEVMARVRD